MGREKIVVGLSRAMFVVAVIAVLSLVLEYCFYLSEAQERLVHLIDIIVVVVFMMDAAIRFGLSRRRLAFLRTRWPAIVILGLIVAQFFLVAHLSGRGWLPTFLESRSVLSLTKGYIIVLQIYLVFLIVGQAVRANRSIASFRIHPSRTVMLSFVLIILIGFLLLLTPKATVRGSIPLVDALFSATSAVCVTGLIVADTGRDFTHLGQGIILALIQIGGLGLVTFTAFFALVLRRGLGVRESLVLRGVLTYETIGRIGRTLGFMIGITVGLEAIGATLLFVLTRLDPLRTTGEVAWRSAFHSISAFCNAGFSLSTSSFERFATDVPVNFVMTSLIIIGGLGFPVIMNLRGRRVLATKPGAARSRWSVHSKLVLVTTASLLVIGTVAFLALEWDGILQGKPLGEKLLKSYFASVTARTAGFNTVRTAWLAPPTLFLLAALMVIGGSPGGTAGGVKTSTFALVVMSIRSMFTGEGRVELFKRRIPRWVVSEALSVVAMGILVVCAGIFVLLVVEELPMNDVLFEVVSAFGTVGLSTGITPTLSPVGKIVLMLIMLTGRIGPLTLVLAIGQRRKAPEYDYPEERVVIG